MKTYKDVYHFPLIQETFDNGKILSYRIEDSKNQFVFQFEIKDENAQRNIMNAINDIKPLENKEISFKHVDGYIVNNKGIKMILIRGWGNLTGVGGHNLSVREAINVQDTFAEFIVQQLNKRL